MPLRGENLMPQLLSRHLNDNDQGNPLLLGSLFLIFFCLNILKSSTIRAEKNIMGPPWLRE